MGNLCIPDSLVDPLELTASLPPERSSHRPCKEGAGSEEEEVIAGTCENESKWRERPPEEGLTQLMSVIRVSDMTILSGLACSDYSKLNRHEFRQVVVPPSSARLTVIDRMEREGAIPDEVFVMTLARS
jgi:hypothetical protein